MDKPLTCMRLLGGLLVAGLVACGAPAADREQIALEAAIARWVTAVNAQDATTLTATMTEDVEILDADRTVKGREAVIGSLIESVANGKLIATTGEIERINDVAWRRAGLAQVVGSGDVHASGQALEIWKRVGGAWKLHRRMTSRTLAPDISLSRPSTKEPVLDRPEK